MLHDLDGDEQVAWLAIDGGHARGCINSMRDWHESNLWRFPRAENSASTGVVNSGKAHNAGIPQFIHIQRTGPTGNAHDPGSAAGDLDFGVVTVLGASAPATTDHPWARIEGAHDGCGRAGRRSHGHLVRDLVTPHAEDAHVRRVLPLRRITSAGYADDADTRRLPHIAVVGSDERDFVIPSHTDDSRSGACSDRGSFLLAGAAVSCHPGPSRGRNSSSILYRPAFSFEPVSATGSPIPDYARTRLRASGPDHTRTSAQTGTRESNVITVRNVRAA